MNRDDIKVGIKVVPHAKTIYIRGLEQSIAWNNAKRMNQPYLFVTSIERDGSFLLNEVYTPERNATGDYFNAEDFEIYTGDA